MNNTPLKYNFIGVAFLLLSFYVYPQAKTDQQIMEIKSYVDSINNLDLKKRGHAHYNNVRISEEGIRNFDSGSYLQVFDLFDHPILLIEYTGGSNDQYFYEKYYYRKDTLVYASIKQNIWDGQKPIWSSSYFIINDSIHQRNSISFSKNKIFFLKEFKTRLESMNKKFEESKIPKSYQ